MTKDEFINEVLKLGIILDDEKLHKLDIFYHLLIYWNKKINLTTIVKEEEVYLKHFYDSLTLVKAVNLQDNLTLSDVGTGAGFPGIVLKIVFPNLKITLLDSLNKRINYLNEIIKELELTGIDTVCYRCEDYVKNNREKYDIVVARAVSSLQVLSEIIIPTVKVNGVFIAMKSSVDYEIDNSLDIIKKLDSKIENIIEFNLPIENSKRNLVVIRKLKPTNLKYPRNYSVIKKSLKK